MYGDYTIKHVSQGSNLMLTTAWRPLRVGSTNKENRRFIRLFLRSNVGDTLVIAYANRNADGTFTTPTDSVAHTTVLPGGSTFVEPLTERVTIYGRKLMKKGVTDTSMRVIVTEFS